MRGIALTLVMLALPLAAGCGDDDGGSGGGGGYGASTEQTTTDTTEAQQGGAAPDKAGLTGCLAEAKLELKPGSESFIDRKGQKRTRKGLDIDDTTYLGYVQWPSKSIADVYLSKDGGAAEKAETEAGLFVKAFGLDPGKFVKRSGTVVLLFDDPPPTEQEVDPVAACAGA